MNRPGRTDPEVIRLAATLLMEHLRHQRPEFFEPSEEGTDVEVHAQLMNALKYASEGDGYEIAKQLEREGWDVDADLVEEVDGGYLDEAHERVVAAWVASQKRAPKLRLGDKVHVRPGAFERELTPAEGHIYDINHERGAYTVFVPAWGHVREGLGTHGRVWAWEVVEDWQGAEASLAAVVE